MNIFLVTFIVVTVVEMIAYAVSVIYLHCTKRAFRLKCIKASRKAYEETYHNLFKDQEMGCEKLAKITSSLKRGRLSNKNA